jgi:hypothetical protein
MLAVSDGRARTPFSSSLPDGPGCLSAAPRGQSSLSCQPAGVGRATRGSTGAALELPNCGVRLVHILPARRGILPIRILSSRCAGLPGTPNGRSGACMIGMDAARTRTAAAMRHRPSTACESRQLVFGRRLSFFRGGCFPSLTPASAFGGGRIVRAEERASLCDAKPVAHWRTWSAGGYGVPHRARSRSWRRARGGRQNGLGFGDVRALVRFPRSRSAGS